MVTCLLTHNAFRSPGAASIEELNGTPKKADYFKAKVDRFGGVSISHPSNVDATNIEELHDAKASCSCLSMAVQARTSSSPNSRSLELPFIDTGMGIYQVKGSLAGMIRTTLGTTDGSERDVSDEELDEYDQNIQIAELNMLNAALAVIKWKKTLGFYNDLERESSSIYTIDGNHLLNDN